MAKQKREEKTGEIPNWSWVFAAVGLALVVGTVGFMLYQAFAGDSSPPELAIETEAVTPSGSGYLVAIRITNRGGSAASALLVEGVLQDGEKTVETSTITIDYVPSNSERKAGLFFSKDPRSLELKVLAKGYVEP